MPIARNKTHRLALAGTTPTLIANANPARRYLLLQNQGTKTAFIGFGSAAACDSGFALGIGSSDVYQGGETWEATDVKGNLTTQAIYAKASVAGNVLIIENSDGLPTAPGADVSSSSSSSSSPSSSSSSTPSSDSSSSSSSPSSSSSSTPSSSSSSTAAQNSSSSSTPSSSSSSSSSSSTSSFSSASSSSSSDI
jgi:hypothetical protein